jgi:hypothetical protein
VAAGAATVDLRRELRELYTGGPVPALVDVPELGCLMIDGHGDPNTAPEYAEAVQALYAVAYTIRFALKRRSAEDGGAIDAPVMPLEGLWWVPDMRTFTTDDKSAWDWTMLVVQTEHVTAELASAARETATRKKGLPAIERVRLERFTEGRAAQVLHRGPYSAEGPTIAGLHRFVAEQGLVLAGKHHEIYLGDPRRTAPEKLRTIIRQPVAGP